MRNKFTIGLTALSTCLQVGNAQPLVVEMGGGVGSQGITALYVIDDENSLYLTGSFAWANDQSVSPGILRWDGTGFQSLGCGMEWDCVTPISLAGLGVSSFAVAKWNGDLYLGGSISFTRDGYTYNGIMRWNGIAWLPLAGGTDGTVKSIKVIDDQLIVAGWFTYADTVLANGLARWDGERWHRVLDVPALYIGDGPNLIQDVEKYQGEWYLGGNHSMRRLIKWNGTEWQIVGGGFTGPFSQVNKLQVFDGRLYVAGAFSRCPEHAGVPTNPGSGIVAWDGSAWDDLGGGTCGSPNGTVNGMAWWNGELYACGIFNRMGGQEGHRLAKWDGEQWCMLAPPGFFANGGPNSLAVYNDSLYIGGSFVSAGGEPMDSFVKWIGGDYTYSCGSLTSLAERTMPNETLIVSPNPASAALYLHTPDWAKRNTHFAIHDAIGRLCLEGTHQPDQGLSVSELQPGVYTISLRSRDGLGMATARFIRN